VPSSADSTREEGALEGGRAETPTLDEVDADADAIVKLLDGIPGALKRAKLGREQGRRGEAIALDDL
jgi:hypothetical protein